MTYYSPNPIRLRPKLLADLQPNVYYGKMGALYKNHIQEWKDRGGLLLDSYEPRFRKWSKCNALVLCEAPYTMQSMKGVAKTATDALVIYQPRNWQGHYQAFEQWNPTEETCRRYFDILQSCQTLTPLQQAIADYLDIGGGVIASISDAEMCERMGMDNFSLSFVRRALLPPRSKRWFAAELIVPFYAPEEPGLLPLYQYIHAAPIISGNVRVCTNDGMRTSTRGMVTRLRALARLGCVERSGRIQFFQIDGIKPNWEQIFLDRDLAFRKMEHALAMYEKLPELD